MLQLTVALLFYHLAPWLCCRSDSQLLLSIVAAYAAGLLTGTVLV